MKKRLVMATIDHIFISVIAGFSYFLLISLPDSVSANSVNGQSEKNLVIVVNICLAIFLTYIVYSILNISFSRKLKSWKIRLSIDELTDILTGRISNSFIKWYGVDEVGTKGYYKVRLSDGRVNYVYIKNIAGGYYIPRVWFVNEKIFEGGRRPLEAIL